MMTQAFYTGISGLKSNQTGIDILASNLANISTVGYRGYNVEFASMFEDSLNSTSGSTSNTIGAGVKMQASTMNRDQGVIQLSDQSTDLAIVGNGWFGISGGDNSDNMYTRAGNFTFDVDSDLITPDGHYVLGTMGSNISADGVLTGILPEVPLGEVEVQ
jgi:flagellar hook protein FlgE